MSVFGALDTLATLAQQVYHAGQIMFGGPPHPFAVDEAAPEAERCAREAGSTSSPVKHGPGSRLAEPHLRRESIAAGATPSPGLNTYVSGLGDAAAAGLAESLGVDSIFRSGGQTHETGPRPKLSVPRPPSAAAEPAFTQWLASIDARLAVIQDHLTSAAPGDILPPVAAPEGPAPDPGAGAGQPDWCAAEMRQVADILLATDSPFALSYANDLRRVADEIEHQK